MASRWNLQPIGLVAYERVALHGWLDLLVSLRERASTNLWRLRDGSRHSEPLSPRHECGHEKGWHQPKLYSSKEQHSIALYLITNLFAGVDGLLWQREHRMHHAHTLSDDDAQIPMWSGALLPVCSVDEVPLQRFIESHPLASTMVRWQEVFFLPFLTLVGKHYLGFLTYLRIDHPRYRQYGYPQKDQRLRKLLLLGHYVLLCAAVWLLVWRPTARRAQLSRWRRSQYCGLWLLGCSVGAGLIEPMFLFNHVKTGRSTHKTASDKIAQLCHPINYQMRLPWWMPLDEFLIPVSYHIEHHIAPKVPDENLPRITADIERLALQFGLPFRVEPIEVLAWDFVRELAHVPRDRWGGVGALVPLVLPLIVAAFTWFCVLRGERSRARGRVKFLEAEEIEVEVVGEEKDRLVL